MNYNEHQIDLNKAMDKLLKRMNDMDFSYFSLVFGMALARNFNAMNAYSAMTDDQKKAILARAHNARSEKEMSEIVNSLVRSSTH